MNLAFKSNFFDTKLQNILNNLDEKWIEFENLFQYFCEELKIRRQYNIFVVDGPIAAGKTTIIDRFSKKLKEIHIIPEPVDIWQSIGILDETGKYINILELFYLARNNKANVYYIFLFQVIALVSRIILMNQELEKYSDGNEIIVMERHPMSDNRIFFTLSKDLLDEDLVSKYTTLMNHVDTYVPTYKWIFIGINMESNNYERCINQHISNLKKRNRNEEVTITHNYMEHLYLKFVEFIKNLKAQRWILDYGEHEEDMYNDALKLFEN